ncbi:hypothetical protein niasHS_012382 [Heterodera schachtii]|uniref:C2H2-type domain-containing protein n=1 Tax=Heterodera schachtii TaxID=97005 RepID=A0ABD2IMA5_HETSC
MPMPEMRQRVWNPAVEGKDGEVGGREESEGKSLFPASLVGPFLFAQLRHQFLHQPRPLPRLFPFPFPPPPFPAPPSLSMRPPVAAIPPPFLMVAAMMAAAPRAFHAGAFGTTPTLIPQQLSAFDGSNHSVFPPFSIGIQTPNQCQKGEEGPLAKPTANCQNGEESEWSTKSAPTPNEMSGNKRAKKRKREKVAKNGQNGEGEGEQRNAKKCNTNAKDNNNPIVQMVMSAVAEGTAATTAINLNTCAICGDQFRLTSDLVQHARTNHRQTSRYDRNGPRASIAEEVQRLSKE